MSTNDHNRLYWFVAVALVVAAAGGVFFFVLKARAAVAKATRHLDTLNKVDTETLHQIENTRPPRIGSYSMEELRIVVTHKKALADLGFEAKWNPEEAKYELRDLGE